MQTHIYGTMLLLFKEKKLYWTCTTSCFPFLSALSEFRRACLLYSFDNVYHVLLCWWYIHRDDQWASCSNKSAGIFQSFVQICLVDMHSSLLTERVHNRCVATYNLVIIVRLFKSDNRKKRPNYKIVTNLDIAQGLAFRSYKSRVHFGIAYVNQLF